MPLDFCISTGFNTHEELLKLLRAGTGATVMNFILFIQGPKLLKKIRKELTKWLEKIGANLLPKCRVS
jgi:dihydroorotate dehydrogenase